MSNIKPKHESNIASKVESKKNFLSLFDEPKIVDYTPEEIAWNWVGFRSSMGNFVLEGAKFSDAYILFLKEIARGEYPEEKIRMFDFEKDRLVKKIEAMSEYGLTVDDIYVGA